MEKKNLCDTVSPLLKAVEGKRKGKRNEKDKTKPDQKIRCNHLSIEFIKIT